MRNQQVRSIKTFAFLVMMLGMVAPVRHLSAAQQVPGTYPGQGGSTNRQPLDDQPVETNEARARMEQQREKLAMDDRQKRLVEDTDRLVQLSTELKDEVNKSGKFVTSVTAIRKAEEIERLAHSVRDRMKN